MHTNLKNPFFLLLVAVGVMIAGLAMADVTVTAQTSGPTLNFAWWEILLSALTGGLIHWTASKAIANPAETQKIVADVDAAAKLTALGGTLAGNPAVAAAANAVATISENVEASHATVQSAAWALATMSATPAAVAAFTQAESTHAAQTQALQAVTAILAPSTTPAK